MQVCVAERSQDAEAIYDEIGQSLAAPDPTAQAVYERAAAAVASKRVPPALRGIAVPTSQLADDETCAVRKPEADFLSADDHRRIEALDRALDMGRPPKWVRRIPADDGLLYNVGAAVVANAPSSISSAPSCARAKYVYATALPILNKEFGLWQLSGAGLVGTCRAFVGARGRMRIANLGRTVLGSDVKSPVAILRESKQGTCGEWAYGLREVLVGAGFPRARVINSYIPGFSGTLNHAAAVVECVNDGVVEQRVCDAWALGHQNQTGRVYGEAGFAGAARAVHNCRPLQEWKQAQRASSRSGFQDPDRDDDLGDFKTDRDLAMEWLDENFADRAIRVARGGQNSEGLKGVLYTGLRGLMTHEQEQELARRIEVLLPTVGDRQLRLRMERWVVELRD